MAINFTDSPADGATQVIGGRTYTYNSAKNKWDTTATEVVGPTATVYATVDNLPGTATTGDQAFVSGTNRLYIWNGSGWYNIALINTNPSISGVSSSYSLAIDGTATVITITATDPEGLPITYSLLSDTSGNIATVTQGTGASSNVFTVTPSTNNANAGSFTLTFRASDGVNLATAPASFTLQFSVQNSNYTTALITSEGANDAVNNSFVDSSTNSHTLTAAGNATQTTFSPYRHGGYSNYFDGSGDYLLMSSNAAWTLGTGDFTLEAWIYPTAAWGTWNGIFSATNSGAIFFGGLDSGFGLRSIAVTNIVSSTDPVLNTWTHVAVTRSGTTVRLFYNGVLEDTQTSSQNFLAGDLYIGSSHNGDTFTGYIADARIVKGTAVYTSAFTPPTERLTAITNTSLLTCHLPYIADGSTNGHAITVNGNTKTEPFAPYDAQEYSASSHGGSMYFDGTGDYLTAAGTTIFDISSSTATFTVEAWIYPTSFVSGAYNYRFAYIISKGAVYTGFGYASDGKLRFYTYSGSENYVNSSAGAIKLNTWTHVAAVSNAGSVTLYVNGVADGTGTLVAPQSGGVGVAPKIGSADTSQSADFVNGIISNLRVVDGAAVYTSAFTPPTAPLTAITNTSLLLSGTDAGIIDKSQTSSVLVLDGDTKCSSTQTKYRSTAIYTDGTGDRVRFGINNKKLICDWGVGGEPFTVEWWMYDTQPYTAQHSFGPQTGGGAGAWNSSTGHQWITYWNANILNIYYYGTNGTYNGTTCTAAQLGIVQNQWQHVAHTYDGTTWRLYVDGVHKFHWALPNQPASVSGTFAALGAFAETAYYTAAYYDDVRITKGLARYTGTSSFTPPAAALQG